MATENLNNVVDINLSATKRKAFRIDGDDSRIVYLNTSDMSILGRINEVYTKLDNLQNKASNIMSGIDEDDDTRESAVIIAERLKDIDNEMRDLIDYMFDAPVSSVAAPDGSMYDLFNGVFRYEHIINAFIGQYENNMKSEFDKLTKEVHKHTAKYKKK